MMKAFAPPAFGISLYLTLRAACAVPIGNPADWSPTGEGQRMASLRDFHSKDWR